MNRPVCFSRMEAAIFTIYTMTGWRMTWQQDARAQRHLATERRTSIPKPLQQKLPAKKSVHVPLKPLYPEGLSQCSQTYDNYDIFTII